MFWLFVVALPASAQPAALTRLARDEPEVRFNPGGRTGVCDVVKFTGDGTRLFAVGEDKIVHVWNVTSDRMTPAEPFRWNTFRERRGSIFSLALSADPTYPLSAVAGFGKLTADVAVFDTRTGQLVNALSPATDAAYRSSDVVWALAFSPNGKELAIGDEAGHVWVWKLDGPPGQRVFPVAEGTGDVSVDSKVIWVGYTPDGRAAYAKRDGGVYAAGGEVLFRWNIGKVDKVTASADGKWLAALPRTETPQGSRVEVRSFPDGKASRTVRFEVGRFPDRFALDHSGERLAVGVAHFATADGGKGKRPFIVEPWGEVDVYDLRPDAPKRIARKDRLDMRPDAIAFHPDGQRLATAGGSDHATILWKIGPDGLTELSADRGKAEPLWAVGMTADARYLCFKNQRNPDPAHPNDRGLGDWHAFDLQKWDWAAGRHVPVPPENTRDGWRIEFSPANDFDWYAVEPGGTKHRLPLDNLRDDFPRCYTFLPAGRKGAVRVAVGHLWGLSVFELAPGEEPKRVRRFTGHAGYVTSVAPALEGKALVTCARDQSVALWSLADFPSEPVLGAKFADRGGQFVVEVVDTGSPAEEAGLSRGDTVTRLFVGGDPKPVPRAEWAKRIAALEPGQELAMLVAREGVPGEHGVKTSLLHRPVARFLPTRDREWVAYTYRQCYFVSSANGDRYLLWQISPDRADMAPQVFPAERFRVLNKPEKVADVVSRLTREPCNPILPDLFPPVVKLTAKPPAANGDVEVTVMLQPRARQDGKVNPVDQVEVWVNGHHRAAFLRTADRQMQVGREETLTFTVPGASLRAGTNDLRAVAVARDAGVGESAAVLVNGPAHRPTRRLFGAVAGINDYDAFGDGLSLNSAVSDAERAHQAWVSQYSGGESVTRSQAGRRVPLLTDEAVTRKAILDAVQSAKQAGPDDLFMLFLSGHGVLGKDVGGSDEWYYAIPRAESAPLSRTDLTRRTDKLRNAFLRDEHLFDALASLRCQTIVILDCCHSGAAAKMATDAAVTNRTRSFRPYGYGPVVLASCGPAEKSYENDGQGYFTKRLVQALGSDFSAADTDGDGKLSATELYEYLRSGVAKDVSGVIDSDTGERIRQTPQIVPPADTLSDLILAEPQPVR